MNITLAKKLFAWLLSVVVLLLSLVICVLVIAVKSETLSLWALQQAVLYSNDNTGMEIDFSAATGTLERGFRLQNFHLALADDGGTLALEDVNLEWDLWALARKEVVIEGIEFSTLSFVAGSQTGSGEDSDPADLRAIIDSLFTLPVDIRLRSLAGSQLSYTDSTQTQEMDALQFALRINEDELRITDLRVEMQGVRLESSSLTLNRQLQVAGNLDWHLALFEPELAGSLVVGGDLETLAVEHQLHQPVTMNSRGRVVSGIFGPAQFSFQLEHMLPEFSPAVIPQLADQDWLLGMSGNFVTSGDLENIVVESAFQAELRDMGGFDITLEVAYESQQARISLLQVNSRFGALSVAGDLALAPDMTIALDWQFVSTEVPMLPADISVTEVDAAGQLQMGILDDDVQARLVLDQLDAILNGYPLQVSGHAEVSDQMLTDLELMLDAGSNTLQIQGRAGSELDLQWALTAPALEVLMPGLSGELNGSGSVSGSTEAPAVFGNVDARSLQYAREDLVLSATVLNVMATYQPDVITASLSSGVLTYRSESMSLNTAGISLEASYRPEALSLDLLLTELALQSADYSRTIDMVQLDVSGLAEDHNLALDIQGPGLTFNMNAEGALAGGRWDGVVQSALLSSRFSDLELREPISLQVDSSQVSVSEHCWLLDRATLCPTVQWQSDTGAAGEISLSGLPLSYLTRRGVLEDINAPDIRSLLDQKPEGLHELQDAYGIFLPFNSYIRGELSALVGFSGLGLDASSRTMELSLLPDSLVLGIVSNDLTENMTQAPQIREFSIVEPVWEVSLDGAELETRFDFGIYEVGEEAQALQGHFTSSIGLSAGEELSGNLALDFPQMNWLETLLPQVRDTQGRLELDARLMGNLERPLLQTSAMLREGSFQVPELGLSVNNLEMDVNSDGDNDFTLVLKGESGGGTLDMAGQLYHPFLEESREMTLDIRGDNFQVMNQSGAIVHISPELVLIFDAGALAVEGELLVPVFDLIAEEAITTTGADAVNVSRDVVVIRRAEEDTAVSSTTGMESIPMDIEVDVLLGEDVRLRAYGLDLQLEGAVSVEQTAGRPLLMYGEVGITEGFYEIYGQRLTVERGQLLFLGNPGNPALEIRASRKVDTSTVGIQMNGTLNNIQGRLYSVPTYPETEILAMLVTGRSFGNSEPVDSDRLLATIANLGIERGQGITNAIQTGLGLDTIEVTGGTNLEDSSLGVGKYITPELFMRYDVGLFHRESVLTMIYTLSERLRLELETGISQSVDLTYTVEK